MLDMKTLDSIPFKFDSLYKGESNTISKFHVQIPRSIGNSPLTNTSDPESNDLV